MYGAIDRRRRPATNRALAPPSKRLATAAAAAAAFVAGACIVARRPGAQAPPPALLGARASSPSPSSPASSSDDAATSSTASPHVLLLYADDMGWADVGWNNADVANVTANLDRLATAGVRLDNFCARYRLNWDKPILYPLSCIDKYRARTIDLTPVEAPPAPPIGRCRSFRP